MTNPDLMTSDLTNMEIAKRQGVDVQPPDPHNEPAKMARRQLGAIFDHLEEQGSTREALFALAQISLSSIERAMLSSIDRMPRVAQATIARNVMLSTVILRVLEGSPLFGPSTLRLQLEHEVDRILGQAHIASVKGDAANVEGRPTVAVRPIAPPEDDASAAERGAFAAKVDKYVATINKLLGREHPDVVLSVAVSWLLGTIATLETVHGINMDFEALADDMHSRLSVARAQYPPRA